MKKIKLIRENTWSTNISLGFSFANRPVKGSLVVTAVVKPLPYIW